MFAKAGTPAPAPAFVKAASAAPVAPAFVKSGFSNSALPFEDPPVEKKSKRTKAPPKVREIDLFMKEQLAKEPQQTVPKIESKPQMPIPSLLANPTPAIKLGGGFSVLPPPIVIPPLGKAVVSHAIVIIVIILF